MYRRHYDVGTAVIGTWRHLSALHGVLDHGFSTQEIYGAQKQQVILVRPGLYRAIALSTWSLDIWTLPVLNCNIGKVVLQLLR